MKKITFFNERLINKYLVSKTKLLFTLIITSCMTVVGQNVNIPDANFKAFLVSNTSINTNGDNEIQVSEANTFNGSFNAVGLGISNLTGIEAFTNLAAFSASNNMITSVDLSQNTNLVEVRLVNNLLSNINVSALTNLIFLQLTDNPITSLDVSNNPNLETLLLDNGQLTTIDVSNNPSLRQLEIVGNQLASVNITGLTMLEEIILFNNQITSIDLSTNSQLTFVRLDSNNLTSLNIANGNNGIINTFFADLNPNLSCIQIDAGFTPNSNWFADSTTSFSSNCNSTQGITYVDLNATGNNDGTSWANAYTDLWGALDNINNGDEIWIAGGTYRPSLYPVKTYGVNNDNIKIYGGFSGTESSLQDRDISLIHTTNETILSGDINNNDDTNVSFGNSTRTDNSNAVIKILKPGIILDGLTISDGYADELSGNDRIGAGIYLDPIANVFTMENCIIKDNVAFWAAGMYISPTFNSNIKINACVFENNLGVLTGAFYAVPVSGSTMNLRITNSLFNGNRTEDDSVTDPGNIRRGLGAPAGWIRAFNSNSVTNTTLVNNTFVNNVATGTGASTDFPVLGLSKSNSNSANSSNVIANNIFWGNTRNNSQTSIAVGQVVDAYNFTSSQIYDNIDEDGFTNLGVGVGLINNSNTDPNLTTDFKLQSTSTAAIDEGNNNAIPTGIELDLAGNDRIENTTVDIGAYEFSSTLSIDDVNFLNFTLYPNPATSLVNIKTNKKVDLISIYSVLGKKIITKKDTKTIDISQLNRGVYLMRVYYSNQSQSTTLRFIKN